MQPRQAFISDLNEELIEVYEIVRDDVDKLIISLKKHRNDEQYYYEIREKEPKKMKKVERVSRFIFLNKTCYNGLYRVNKNGKFNVPFGRYKNPDFVNEDGLKAANKVLQGVKLKVGDFSQILKRAKSGDFIYLDPPYHPVTATANFTDYTAIPFGEPEQKRLAEVYYELFKKGCQVMLSNSDTSLINELYKDFAIKKVRAKRSINCRADRRGPVNEVVVISWL
jgi:DNA adenine methylase